MVVLVFIIYRVNVRKCVDTLKIHIQHYIHTHTFIYMKIVTPTKCTKKDESLSLEEKDSSPSSWS